MKCYLSFIHQSFELWFKQIIFELDGVIQNFPNSKTETETSDISVAIYRLHRVREVFKLLNHQFEILKTMTPLDFLEFRDLLSPASGFQSLQFRIIEAKLGLKLKNRQLKDYYKKQDKGGFTQQDYEKLGEIELQESLFDLMIQWLEEKPFFQNEYWLEYLPMHPVYEDLPKFWSDYRSIYSSTLGKQKAKKLKNFDQIMFEEGMGNFSAASLRAALFIMLYRDLPIFQLQYKLIESLTEIDEALNNWRYKHLTIVHKMIGKKNWYCRYKRS